MEPIEAPVEQHTFDQQTWSEETERKRSRLATDDRLRRRRCEDVQKALPSPGGVICYRQ